ncbi:cupin domain-containing protein [Agrococcus carbonis]|uniref:Cytoplasmic protein n=1 Tax=Agrococcus carbonis TaxID=684552 RepID=A0A1H1Q1N2_9MICO|nr:cytoplasmic protein [Agrococcus carbonis]SDS17441.1 hypothetical protein SAMN04489719_1710 [Agrococcus carbonis]
MDDDPVATNPQLYSVVFENERVRVLEYRDEPGAESTPHRHPDSVMVTLSDFDRRLSSGVRAVDVAMAAGQARWLPAQAHAGTNIGSTETHVIFVELKEPGPAAPPEDEPLGPR